MKGKDVNSSDFVVWSETAKAASPLLDAIEALLQRMTPERRVAKRKDTMPLAKYEITPVFGEYVSRNEDFAAALVDLRDVVRSYIKRPAKRPLNILLGAQPGSGKSFLVKQLAQSLAKKEKAKVTFEEHHVVAFRSVDDLLDVFHRIQSANLEQKVPFVLFDEVDGLVAGRHVLANFLAPMWDGVFHSGKDMFTLGKAVFVFAASSMVPSPALEIATAKKITPLNSVSYSEFARKWLERVEKDVRKKGTIEKCQDFIDRIDVVLCVPPIHEALVGREKASSEYVDIACLLIRKHFPKVKRVEKAALMAIAKTLVETGSYRKAESSVFCSCVSAAGVFRLSDFPAGRVVEYAKVKRMKALRGGYVQIVVNKPTAEKGNQTEQEN